MRPIKEILKGMPKHTEPLQLKPGNLWYPAAELKGIEYSNICIWYDYTFVPMKGHKGDCKWKFDGQIWRHL